MAVRGGSAGRDDGPQRTGRRGGVRAPASSWYGVTDLMGLVATTHDFEAHYTDRLIGPLPECRAALRGAVARAAGPASMTGSVLLLQGTEDAVVPPAQAERMRDALHAAGTRCDLGFFEGEGHGFRRADTLTACLEAELAFYLEELRPLGSTEGCPSGRDPLCEAFADAMLTTTHDARRSPTWRRATLGRPWRRAMGAGAADLTRGRATRCCTAASAVFALLTIYTSTERAVPGVGTHGAAPRSPSGRWPRASWPGSCAAPAGAQAGRCADDRRQHRRAWLTRIVVAVCVFVGSLAIPMGFEILWRFDGVPGSHLQPEVTTVEVGGQDLVHGQDPYIPLVQAAPCGQVPRAGRAELRRVPALPAAHGGGRHPERDLAQQRAERRPDLLLPDHAGGRRGGALPLPGRRAAARSGPCRRSSSCPLASLPLATGGDDIPVVAFLLLAVVLAQRRRPFASGVVFGIASAMKFTAWPLAVLALFAARDRHGERRPFSMLAGMIVVAVPTIFPFALRGPFALIDDVVLFPLGLSAIPTTAASALPGSRPRERVPVAQPRPAALGRASCWRSCWPATSTGTRRARWRRSA